MKKVFLVLRQDLKSIVKNPAAIFILVGLCLLPSLYAWINIKACWDPYANTGNLPVAVVNLDEGGTFDSKTVNVGDDIVAQLKKNSSIHWVFTDQWQGDYGLNEGKYYAMIEIPANFSQQLITLTTAAPQKPQIIYHVSEKENAIANKITSVAVDQLAEKVKSSFVGVVNKQILSELNLNESSVQKNKTNILQLRDTLTQARGDIAKVESSIRQSNADAASLQNYLAKLQGNLPTLSNQITALQNVVQADRNLTEDTRDSLVDASRQINEDATQVQTLDGQIQTLLAQMDTLNRSADTAGMIQVLDQTIAVCDTARDILQTDSQNVTGIAGTLPNTSLTSISQAMQAAVRQLDTLESLLKNTESALRSGSAQKDVSTQLSQLSTLSSELAAAVTSYSNSVYTSGVQAFSQVAQARSSGLDQLGDLLTLTKAVVPELNVLANFGISSSKLSVKEANDVQSRLAELDGTLQSLQDKTDLLTQENLDSLLNLMRMNSDEVSAFLSSPIQVKQENVYQVGTFGEGLTPFYTVLAIWVGALLTCALLTVECRNLPSGETLNLAQKHFGKMLLFLIITSVQSPIIVTGDIFLLGVHPVNVGLFYGMALICSVTFTVIIFTLVSLFGNVGKAIAVVIMVFQIAGAGGIYPIQTNPSIFGRLEPLWPFTYAIDAFREAIAGPYWSTVVRNIAALGIFFAVFLSMVVLKKPFHHLNKRMEAEYRKAQV